MNRPHLAAAAAALALALALPAHATQKMPTAAPRPAVAARPPPPSAAAPVPLPPPPVGAAGRPRVAWFGAGLGAVSAFDVGKGLALSLDYGLLRTPRSWRKLALEWHLVARLSRPAGDSDLTATVPSGFTTVTVDAGQESVEVFLVEVVPTARVLWTFGRGVALFADGGLGLCQTVEKYDRSEMFAGRSDRTDYVTGAVVNLGLGLSVDVSTRWRVLATPVAFSLQLGPKFSAFTPMLGVAYRL